MGFREYLSDRIAPHNPDTNSAILCSVPFAGKNLAENGSVIIDPSKPLGVRTTPQVRRVSAGQLESAYTQDATVFNGINKAIQLIMSAGYSLVGDEESVKFFTVFLESVGQRGNQLEWEELLNTIFKHQMIFGNAWVEKIPSKLNPDRIVDLQFIDPKQMDYAKNSDYIIVLDEYGDPVGYTQTLPYNYTAHHGDKPPKSVQLGDEQVFFKPERISHFRLYNTGDSFYPVGLIEPVWDSVNRKVHLEQAHANSFKKNGFGRLVVKMGNDQHPPTQEQIQRAIEKIQNADNMSVFGIPYYQTIELLEPKGLENLQEQLRYYSDQVVTGLGLPKSFITGSGDDSPRSVLNRQEAMTKQALKDMVNRTVRVIEKSIIKPVAESNKVNPVKIKWGTIAIEELDGKARRLAFYSKNGLLTPDIGIEDELRMLETLPGRGDDYEERRTEVKPKSNTEDTRPQT
ncbi:MAG TPA: phage portal protein [Patescibacteria group bacterium]|nr:phage portal protein [Patescibacteria group bacterium]